MNYFLLQLLPRDGVQRVKVIVLVLI